MKYLQILNAALMAFGAAMGVIMGVVVLLYAVHLDDAPRLEREMPMLLTALAGFLALGAVAGAAWWGHRRQRMWAWLAEGLLALNFAALIALLLQLRF